MIKDSPSFKITKKRSLSELPRRTLSNNWQFQSKTNFSSLAQTQLFQALTQRSGEQVLDILFQGISDREKDKGTILKQLTDQKGQNEGLRKSIQQAIDKAKLERRESYLVKDQLFIVNEDRNKIQKDHKQMSQQYYELSGKYHMLVESLERCSFEKNEAQRELKQIKGKLGNDLKAVDNQLKTLRGDNEKLSEIARDEGLAVERIKVLEMQLRRFKLDKNSYEETIKRLNQEVREYEILVQSTKPELQRQTQRIKYYERLVSDLQKKADQFYQRQYELQREIQRKQKQIAKYIASTDNFKKLYEVQQQKHKVKVVELKTTTQKLSNVEIKLDQLTMKHQQQIVSNQNLNVKVQQLQVVITTKTQQVTKQASHIDFLESHQKSMKQAIQQAKLISAQSNKFVHKRDMQAYKLKQDKQYLQSKIDEIVQRYKKFDEYYMQSSVISKNKLKDSVVTYVKSCSKIEIDMNELKKSLDSKDLQFLEEREMFKRDLEMKELKLPKDVGLYEQIFREKNEQIRVLQNSNAQLYKSTTGYQDIINTLQHQNTRYEFDIKDLQRHIIQLQKLQKQNVQLKIKEKQQESSINQLKKQQKQLDQRLIKKSQQLSNSNQKILILQKQISKLLTQIDTLQIRINMKSPIKQVPIQKPIQSEEDLERILSLQLKQKSIMQAIEKMSNALKSINIYFACGFCDKLVKQPYTVLPCGHNYCQQCREGFNEDCFQCSNSMPIQGVFKNVHLESTLPRVQFFNMVFQNVSKLFAKSKDK